jgi:hypothetical protein
VKIREDKAESAASQLTLGLFILLPASLKFDVLVQISGYANPEFPERWREIIGSRGRDILKSFSVNDVRNAEDGGTELASRLGLVS